MIIQEAVKIKFGCNVLSTSYRVPDEIDFKNVFFLCVNSQSSIFQHRQFVSEEQILYAIFNKKRIIWTTL